MHLPYLIFLFAQIVFSTPFSDIWARDPTSSTELGPLVSRDVFYTAYPSDLGNAAQIAETQEFLKGLYGSEDVLQNRNADGLVSWRITLKDGDTTDQLKSHPGLRTIEPEGRPSGATSKAKRDDIKYYITLSKDPNNDEETKTTHDFLYSKVADQGPFVEFDLDEHVHGWGGLAFTEAQKIEVDNYPGIQGPLQEEQIARAARAIPPTSQPTDFQTTTPATKRSNHLKRDLSWTKETNAVKDLVMDSQPPGTDLNNMNDFVHEVKAGDGLFIYVIDEGVQVNVKNRDGNNEFRFEPGSVIQSKFSRETMKQIPEDDDSPVAHGTQVASKALGQLHGVAKGATLIPVKISMERKRGSSQIVEGYRLALRDIMRYNNIGEPHKSIVVCSLSIGDHHTRDTALNTREGHFIQSYLDQLFALGVPVVVPAGNDADEIAGSLTIDAIPMVLGNADTPLVVVGANSPDGTRAPFSQVGPQLTIYAPGCPAQVQGKTDRETLLKAGTSIAAPAVAGVIATYMAYDEVPWDKNKQELDKIKAIKEYIQTDKSSWERKANSGINIIWNGATKEAHDSVGANPSSCSGTKKRQDCSDEPLLPPEPAKLHCVGLGSNKYAGRERVLKIIDEKFCPEAAEQGHLDKDSGSIARTYNEGTLEEVHAAMDWAPGENFTPDLEKCKAIMREITDSCDTDNSRWKSGGEKGDGPVNYRWKVERERRPIDQAHSWGGCDNHYSGVFDVNTVWGAGWLGDDNGDALLDGLKKKGLSPTEWSFNYGGGDDHREWTATFRTPIWMEAGIEAVIESVAKDVDVECA